MSTKDIDLGDLFDTGSTLKPASPVFGSGSAASFGASQSGGSSFGSSAQSGKQDDSIQKNTPIQPQNTMGGQQHPQFQVQKESQQTTVSFAPASQPPTPVSSGFSPVTPQSQVSQSNTVQNTPAPSFATPSSVTPVPSTPQAFSPVAEHEQKPVVVQNGPSDVVQTPQFTQAPQINQVSITNTNTPVQTNTSIPTTSVSTDSPHVNTPQSNIIQAPSTMPNLDQHQSIIAPTQDAIISGPTPQQVATQQRIQQESVTNMESLIQNQERKPSVKPVPVKTSKVALKNLLFGCIFFLLVIMGFGAFILYFFAQNPDRTQGLIDIETSKSLLKVFATVFFGFLFFTGFGFVVLNIHRLVTLKNVRKVGYGVGVFFGFILLFGSLIGGKFALEEILNMSGNQHYVSNDLLLVGVPMKDGFYQLDTTPGLKLIAPMSLFFQLNANIIEKTLINTIGQDTLDSVTLDCDNGQVLELPAGSLVFEESCLFLEKKAYNIGITLNHTDKQTGAPKAKTIQIPLEFDSEIKLSTSQGPISLNDNKSEILVGKAPQRVFVDASDVFTDLQLGQYDISRDIDANDTYDIANDAEFSSIYKNPQIQTVYYTIPGVGAYVYPLTFRVEQSDVPICDITFENIKDATYNIITVCSTENGPISKYNFTIIDEDDENTEVDSITSKKPQIKYDFPSNGNFHVEMSFVTAEGKKGFAESETIDIGNLDFTVNHDILFKGSEDKKRQEFTEFTPHTYDKQKREITLQKIPMLLHLKVNGITPVLQGTEVKVFLNGSPIFSKKEDEFEFTITDTTDQVIDLVITNINAEAETTISIPVLVNQAKIIPNFQAIPDTSGESPFEVTFDASATEVTDPDDKLIYFGWDFGDGEVQKNSSTSIISHVYRYNDDLDSGMYYPKVTVTTKKGLSTEIALENPIIVEKPVQKSRISIDSHPSQAAKVGETVTFSLRTDGIIENVFWDFDDGSVVELPGRGATETRHQFTKPGKYKVKADITYDNKTTALPTITILVD